VYCQRASEGTVEFRSVWHSEEAADALETGALAPFDSVGLDRTETTFDLIESFRTAEVDAEQPTTEPRMAERED
jgi:succinylglutamate desuccinylase